MKNELNIRIGSGETNCILLDGFYDIGKPTKNLHKHNYTEIHIISGGKALFELETEIFSLDEYNVYAVPAGQLHRFVEYEPNIRHSAFLIDIPIGDFLKFNESPALIDLFFKEITQCAVTDNHSKVASYISLICINLFPQAVLKAQPITDTAFIINNFFSLNYNRDTSLADLSAELYFSEKQTARLVLKYTGFSFKQALVNYRMSIAKHLAETSSLSLAKIAEQVGYKSYNGFLKAYKQHFK